MITRLSALFRGIGLTFLILGVAVAITAARRHSAVTAPGFRLSALSQHTAHDATTGLYAYLLSTHLRTAGQSPSLEIQVELSNVGSHQAGYNYASGANFQVVAADGSAYAGTPIHAAVAHSLAPGQAFTFPITIAIPAKPGLYQLVWNDDGNLLPPKELMHFAIKRG